VDAEAKQQRGGAVAQVVEANARESGPLWQRIETPLQEVGGVQGLAHSVWQDQPVVVPLQAEQEPLLALIGEVTLERVHRDGQVFGDERTTVEQFLHAWLRSVETSVGPRTWIRYEQLIRPHAVPHIGKVRLTRLGARHLDQVYGELVRAGLPMVFLDVGVGECSSWRWWSSRSGGRLAGCSTTP
jgi:Phage integrase, N-terminal SAM-like domain